MQIEGRQITAATLQAVVIRKDGTRENLGVVAYWHRNPLRRLWARLKGVRGRFTCLKVS